VLYKYLSPPNVAFSFDAVFVKIQDYYQEYKDQLPSDPACRLDSFFDLVSAAVSPKVIPPADGKDQKLPKSPDSSASGRKITTQEKPTACAAAVAGGDSSSAQAVQPLLSQVL
jgi:hypothetical protein